jgi:hypothetical protein
MKIDFGQVVLKEEIKEKRIACQKAIVAETRYNKETQGIVVDGVSINTERDSQAMITGAALSAVLDDTYVCRWKTPNGFVDLTASELISVSQSMRKYVQACFDRESELIEAIVSDQYNDSMLTEGWPDAEIQN